MDCTLNVPIKELSCTVIPTSRSLHLLAWLSSLLAPFFLSVYPRSDCQGWIPLRMVVELYIFVVLSCDREVKRDLNCLFITYLDFDDREDTFCTGFSPNFLAASVATFWTACVATRLVASFPTGQKTNSSNRDGVENTRASVNVWSIKSSIIYS